MADGIDLVLVTGAGASAAFGASGARIAGMPEWCNHLCGALGARDSGAALLVGLNLQMKGPEFERQLGRFFASARAFRDAKELMTIEDWHGQVTSKIDEASEVVHETLYALFGRPQVDLRRAEAAYRALLAEIGIGPGTANWVYATTNYDTIGDEALEGLRFRVESAERHPIRAGDTIIDPEPVLGRVAAGVPILHLHGKIGWYRRSADDGGQAIAVNMDSYQPGFGTALVMLPDPNKVYDSDPVINTIFGQFEEALSRARRVLVLGHSLSDDQIVSAIATHADPAGLGVTVYGHPSDPDQPADPSDPIVKIQEERFPESSLIPIRFGEEDAPDPIRVKQWFTRVR
jgi:hypothetical protein